MPKIDKLDEIDQFLERHKLPPHMRNNNKNNLC